MLRGFRWQLLALILSVAVFVAVLLTGPGSAPQSTPVPTAATAQPSPTEPAAQDSQDPDTAVQPTTPPLVEPATPVSGEISTYREAVIGQVGRLNPLLANLNPVDADIAALIFEGLTRINQYGEPVPALAQEWVVSADGLEYVVRLRDDILWQDGISFTAADVAFTMSLLRSRDFPGDEALSEFWRTVETEVLDDHLVRFRLTQPLGSFLDALRIGILPEHALAGMPATQLDTHLFNLSPVGTGPYQLETLRTDANGQIAVVDLRAAPVYRQRPEAEGTDPIERVRFVVASDFDDALRMLQNGEVDGYATGSRAQRQELLNRASSGDIDLINAVGPSVGVLIFNWRNEDLPVFDDQRVRQALMTALDRSSLVERNLTNQAVRADSPLLVTSWAYAPDLPWPDPDLDRARFLLESARLERSEADAEAEAAEEGETETNEAETSEDTGLFSFTILTPSDPALLAIAQEIANQWSQLDVNVTVEPADIQNYRARLESGDFEAAIVELSKSGTADPDAYPFWHEGQYPDGQNYGGVNDQGISELLERARREPNGLNRSDDYRRFQEVFVARAIAIPLYYPLYTYAVTPRVGDLQLGFIGDHADRFLMLQRWAMSG